MEVCMYVCMCLRVCMYECICIFVCIYVCMFVLVPTQWKSITWYRIHVCMHAKNFKLKDLKDMNKYE